MIDWKKVKGFMKIVSKMYFTMLLSLGLGFIYCFYIFSLSIERDLVIAICEWIVVSILFLLVGGFIFLLVHCDYKNTKQKINKSTNL